MIELRISKTCMFATTGKHAGWQRYDDERKSFPDMAAAREWLRQEYGTAKRAAMYRDTDKGPIQCGYVIGQRNKWRAKGEALFFQDWIEFRECKPVDPNA